MVILPRVHHSFGVRNLGHDFETLMVVISIMPFLLLVARINEIPIFSFTSPLNSLLFDY